MCLKAFRKHSSANKNSVGSCMIRIGFERHSIVVVGRILQRQQLAQGVRAGPHRRKAVLSFAAARGGVEIRWLIIEGAARCRR